MSTWEKKDIGDEERDPGSLGTLPGGICHRTLERVVLLGSDYLSRGFSLTNTRRVDNGQHRVFKQSP